MTAWYLPLKSIHMSLAFLSGGLFLIRGIVLLAGSSLATARPVRRLSHVIDSMLLLTALLLLLVMQINPFGTPWLAAKLGFLLAYITFGIQALHRARTQTGRTVAFVLALCCFVMIVTIARSHHPLGFVR